MAVLQQDMASSYSPVLFRANAMDWRAGMHAGSASSARVQQVMASSYLPASFSSPAIAARAPGSLRGSGMDLVQEGSF